MILDKLTVKNTIIFVLIKLFIINFLTSIYFRLQVYAIIVSLIFIGIGWYLIWLFVLQRFKIIKELVEDFI